MVTYTQLDTAVPGDLEALQELWDTVDRLLERAEPRLRDEVLGPVRRSGWAGSAADSAYRSLARTGETVSACSMMITAVRARIQAAQTAFTRAKSDLEAVKQHATASGVRILPDGTLHCEAADTTGDSEGKVQELTRQLEAALQSATRADEETAAALLALRAELLDADPTPAEVAWAPNQSAKAVGLDLAAIPNDPKAAAEWWKRLTPRDQELFLEAFPQKIGGTNGLPAMVRDEANRISLTTRIALEKAELARTDDPKERGRLLDRVHALESIQKRLDKNPERQAEQQFMLLGFDPAGDSRTIMAVGNPDTAKHVATWTPGMATDLDSLDGNLERVTRLQDTADKLTPGERGDVATIMWFNYDAPDGLIAASFADDADKAAPALDGFIDGLRANRADQHVTAVAHSYGSTTLGTAARSGDGVAVDDIVVAGSPGMRVGRAEDLNIDPRHVWAEGAPDDPVPASGAHGPFVMRTRHGVPVEVGRVVPSDEMFGGNVMTTDTRGHSDYWEYDKDGNPTRSLENQAKVVMGTYSDPDPINQPQLKSGSSPR